MIVSSTLISKGTANVWANILDKRDKKTQPELPHQFAVCGFPFDYALMPTFSKRPKAVTVTSDFWFTEQCLKWLFFKLGKSAGPG